MKRYQHQLILSEIGKKGQNEVSKASVLIVGAGGLGSIAAGYLTAMGVSNLGICDFDVVEESNLHRQFFYTPQDVGLNKANLLAQKLQIQNPHINIKSFTDKVDESNVESLFSDYQIVCDCSDNVATRLLVNDNCSTQRLPLVHGAVSEWQGYISVFHYKQQYTYADLFARHDLLNHQSCSINGISSPICGIVGSYMANEVIKVILKSEFVMEGKILYINGLNNLTRYLRLKKTNII
ncbi:MULTISPECIES: HesA/MoeB/ThiF family protein [unclassified Imperialibacter]|uniref:HesA/MoeB/ThiF family protein n=1 Tax=unclassified Imperialibacter TaxID=2629706 RepID=UPI001258F2FD|nr:MULTISPECIES: HesA/MoeB/ThiF family protein [unclassified Imperialibacter]CAD5250453.1 Thiamine biosynthesis protein ThiF [Imperialibacter sp. 75]CAD5286890.1 Thiamine biosynthesis protein ThiF [Imperialibacter sp. 89]VVT05876.1 Thiamine biosynthesis protein ThiF [Imperialibacter sp. EC-SDR9]